MARALALLAAAAALCPSVAAFSCSREGRVEAECAALGALYGSAGGPTWARTAGWAQAAVGLPGADYCAFDGVGCDADGHVTSLYVRAAAKLAAKPHVAAG